MNRRSLLIGLGSLIAAPAIVRSESLMRVTSRLLMPELSLMDRMDMAALGNLIAESNATFMWKGKTYWTVAGAPLSLGVPPDALATVSSLLHPPMRGLFSASKSP